MYKGYTYVCMICLYPVHMCDVHTIIPMVCMSHMHSFSFIHMRYPYAYMIRMHNI